MIKKIIIIAAVILCSFSLAAQIAEEEISVDDAELKKKFDSAVEKFNSVEQESSIYDFNEIILLLTSAVKDGTVNTGQVKYLENSYEYRARAYFNSGQLEDAQKDIRSIMSLSMEYSPAEDASRKFIKLFNQLKKKMIGYLKVETVPPGAKIFIEGNPIGYSNTPLLKQKIGYYILRAVKEGYEEFEREIEIKSGKANNVIIDLKRISAALEIQTSPPGVEIFVNGKLSGTTKGKSDIEQHEALRLLGFDPEVMSAFTKIEALRPGKYKIEMKKVCYQPLIVNLDLSKPIDYQFDPFVLASSQGELRIVQSLPEAEIFLDGQTVGKGNQVLPNLCTGPYTVIVRFPAGKYLKQFTLRKNEEINIVPSVKPTLLALGVINGKAGQFYQHGLTTMMMEELNKIETLNTYFPGKELSEDERFKEGLLKLEGQKSVIMTEGDFNLDIVLNKWKDYLLRKYESDLLFLVLKLENGEYAGLLFEQSHPYADRIIFGVLENDEAGRKSISSQVKRLDNLPRLIRPWLGIYPVDSDNGEGIIVLEVIKDSPADHAGLKAHDRVLFINKRRITTASRYNEIVTGLKPGESIPLKVKSGGKTKDVTIVVARTLLTPEPVTSAYLANRILAELISGTRYSNVVNDRIARDYLKGVLYLYLGAFDVAKNSFLLATQGTSDALSKGVISYFLSIASRMMGDTFGAEQYEKEFLNKSDCRLFHKCGTPVSLIHRYEIFP